MTNTLLHRLTEAELSASLVACLAQQNGNSPLWLFAYGSLIWRPDLNFDRRVPARVHGYHRRLCLWSRVNRGTPENPGLVAGLDRGGSCMGVAYRIPAESTQTEFKRLWEREMFLGSYSPRWLDCRLADSTRVKAVAFVVRRDVPNYAGKLTERQILEVFDRGCCGRYGTSLEYLVNTVQALREHGIVDPHFERLARHAGIPAAKIGRTLAG
jgi:cation transport protein ChaC